MNRLRARVLAILAAAAIPAILLVSALAYRGYEAAKATALDALDRDVALLASRIEALPPAAGRLAWLLASDSAWNPALSGDCEQRLKSMLLTFPGYNGVFIFQGDRLICSAGPPLASDGGSFDQLGLRNLMAEKPQAGLLTGGAGRPVLFAAARASAVRDVVTVVTIDPTFLGQLLSLFRSFDSSHADLIDRDGRTVAVRAGQQAAAALEDQTPVRETAQVSLRADAAGVSYVVTSRRFMSPDVWLTTQQRETDVFAEARNQLALAVVAPVLTLLLVGFAVWLGLTQFVIRWINRLILVTRAYSEGDLGARVGDAKTAPLEIRELAQRFDGLADRMAERAIELEGEVVQKRRYIRELHHRVKNNLQVIASLLALQKRNLPPQQRDVLRFPEDRVNAMAAAFAVSYAQTESGEVGVLSLAREVITRLQSGVEHGHANVRVTISGDDRQVDLDMAIALAMLLAGLLPRVFNESVDSERMTTIQVGLSSDRLIISAVGPAPSPTSVNHLSDRFTRAYLKQLNAQLDEPQPGELRLAIPLPKTEAAKGLAAFA